MIPSRGWIVLLDLGHRYTSVEPEITVSIGTMSEPFTLDLPVASEHTLPVTGSDRLIVNYRCICAFRKR